MKWEWLLPINGILVYVIVRWIFLCKRRRCQTENATYDRALSLGGSICILTLGILASTEILSGFHAMNRRSLILLWGGLDLVLTVSCIVLVTLRIHQGELRIVHILCTRMRRLRANWTEWVVTAILLVVMICIGAAAIRLSDQTVPYNWDSMTYHLGRVAHWYQNGSVEHYASNIDRQILSPPLGEYLILSVYTLAGGSDRSVNLVQGISYLICAVQVYCLARCVGARRWMAMISGILFMSMPIAFAESLTTQNDMVSGVYLLTFITSAMLLWQQESRIQLYTRPGAGEHNLFSANLMQILCMGLCIGYGYLCKPSVCLGMMVFLLPVLASCRRRSDTVRTVISCIFLAAIAAAIMALPELIRMYGTYHAFSSPQAGARQMVGSADPRMLLLNFLKNIAFNLPNVWMPGLPDRIRTVLTALAAMLGINLDDPAISEDGRAYEINAANDYSHDTAVNAGIWWLWLICLVLLAVSLLIRCYRRRQELTSMRTAVVYIRTTIVTITLFWIVVRWEKYEVRYMLPYLALICAAAPLTIQLILTRILPAERMQPVLALLLTIILVPTVCNIRSVITYHAALAEEQEERPIGYYVWQMGEYYPQSALCDAVLDAGYRSVGIYCNGDYYEYPLFALLGSDVRMEHVLVNNETAQFEDETYAPDCILLLGYSLPEEYEQQGELTYHGASYALEYMYDDGHSLYYRIDEMN